MLYKLCACVLSLLALFGIAQAEPKKVEEKRVYFSSSAKDSLRRSN